MCRVKCFYAGVRWAIPLPKEAVLTRQALASALTSALGQVNSVIGHLPFAFNMSNTTGVPAATAWHLHSPEAGSSSCTLSLHRTYYQAKCPTSSGMLPREMPTWGEGSGCMLCSWTMMAMRATSCLA